MKILHLLSGGGIGGIEALCHDIAELGTEQHEFCFLYSGGIIAEEIKQKKQQVYFLYRYTISRRVCALIKLVKEKKYDTIIVHHEGIGIYMYYLILVYFFKKIRFIKYLHCAFEEKYFYNNNTLKNWLNYQILKQTLEHSYHMVAVSEYVKKSYCDEFKCDKNKVSVIYNGIRISEKKETRIIEEEENVFRLLYIGRLVEVKGIRVLLHAVKLMKEKGIVVELDILGEGPQRQEFEHISKEWKLNDRVFFYGQQFQKQKYYDRADAFVYPSIWQEAFGISIVEAMAQGKICIGSNVGGIPEIIENGKDGFLFPAGDSEGLVELLEEIIEKCPDEKKKEICHAAMQKASQFDVNKMIEKLQKIC